MNREISCTQAGVSVWSRYAQRAAFIAVGGIILGCSNEATESRNHMNESVDQEEERFDPTSYEDGSEAFFGSSHLVNVDVTLDANDWSTLGREGRSLDVGNCDNKFKVTDFEYTYFPAELIVDGENLGTVGIRKKGFFGSLTVSNPSLKVNFDRFGGEAEHFGLGRLTLNNNKQDASRIRQCVTYDLFRAAGVPAPRCNFAKVTVNGRSLGTYSNVESIGSRFLRRRFADATGNLYEGQGSDFVDDRLETFQIKTNEENNDRSDLKALTEALKAPDDKLLEALAPHLNLDRFLSYWAMESLTAHWDSYSTLGNNFWLYNDPDSGFEFIPWGTDATLKASAILGGPRLQHVSTDAILSKRLYDLPEIRTRYRERLRTLLNEVWNVDVILVRIDELQDFLDDADPVELDQIRTFVSDRRALIESELEQDNADFTSGDVCFRPSVPISGTFSGICEDGEGDSSLTVNLDGEEITLSDPEVWVRMDASPVVPGAPGIGVSANTDTGMALSIVFSVEEPLYTVGEIPFHATSIVGVVNTPAAFGLIDSPIALVSDGMITLHEAGREPGEPVSGSFSGRLYAAELP